MSSGLNVFLEDNVLKSKDDANPNGNSQAFSTKVKNCRKGKFGKFEPHQNKIDMSRI